MLCTLLRLKEDVLGCWVSRVVVGWKVRPWSFTFRTGTLPLDCLVLGVGVGALVSPGTFKSVSVGVEERGWRRGGLEGDGEGEGGGC